MPLNVGFASSDAIALPCLEALNQSHHNLQVIFTQPDRRKGRGRLCSPNTIQQWALDHNCPSNQPERFDQQAIKQWQQQKLDVMIVMAYGLILPDACLNAPQLGCINIHVSLLPKWRGAAPIQRAIEAGDTQTGISFMQMDKGLDTGDILQQWPETIKDNDTSACLSSRLGNLSAKHLIQLIDAVEKNNIQPQKQNHTLASYAKKLSKQESRINWQHSAVFIENKIRAFIPWPVAQFEHQKQMIRVWSAKALDIEHQAQPGEVIAIDKQHIYVACAKGTLALSKLQWPGKKPQPVASILNGNHHGLAPKIIFK